MDTRDERGRYTSKPLLRPNSRRKNFVLEQDVIDTLDKGSRIFTSSNQTEFLHKVLRGEIQAEDLRKAIGE